MNALIRLLYALLVAAAVVVFAGFAIYSLYQPPKSPRYPSYDYSDTYDSNDSTYRRQEAAYNRAVKKYEKSQKTYQRNVTYILLPMALLSAAAGLYLMLRRTGVIGEGLTLGAVAISIYAIITASLADARVLRFVAVSTLLVIVLLVAHFRFSPPRAKSSKPSIY